MYIFSTIICRPTATMWWWDNIKKKNSKNFFFTKAAICRPQVKCKKCVAGGDSTSKRIYSRATGKAITVSRCDAEGRGKNKKEWRKNNQNWRKNNRKQNQNQNQNQSNSGNNWHVGYCWYGINHCFRPLRPPCRLFPASPAAMPPIGVVMISPSLALAYSAALYIQGCSVCGSGIPPWGEVKRKPR